ncbi:uncharacterized protein LOC112602684 [Melanaphis sacchari]|uniref:uncharacterized protein LOC112602684 n=1 Tax=Melanaphis sacchari TaxID=742174 RepID=UPI000DC15041|nr:uncharacterized protein LOC112602684 [Melanaphis sacchari]XP_025206688.1 uncharacterized protein LOC112602684 [Melanaphis sacchari]XP_025206695.1 uncharacterized protein LOC112602684 [Melanaphis sacchari]
MSDSNFSNSNYKNENCSSTNNILQSQIECLDNTAVITDNYTLYDVLQKFKDQVRVMAARVSQLDQCMNLVNNPADPSTHQEVLKIKKNIINGITHLLKETKPLNYPNFQSLSSVKLLKTYEKISAECKLLLNNIKQDNENIIKRTDRFNNLSIFMKDFQQELNKIEAQNTISTEMETEVAREFKECKSDMYTLLSQVDPSSTLKEILSLLVECNDEDEDDCWVDLTNMPHLVLQCHNLKKQGFVLQNEQNKFLFKLNI